MNEQPLALISDIHSNLEALGIVLEDIERRGISQIICLGDSIGYGPNPREVLKRIQEKCFKILTGNHERALFLGPKDFNDNATIALAWTKAELTSPRYPAEENQTLWSFLETLPLEFEEGDILFLHASPIDPTLHYFLPGDVYNPETRQKVFSALKHIGFGGHTHVPGVFTEDGLFFSPGELRNVYVLEKDKKVFINVGSVGQPRDGDVRTGYVVLEGEKVEFIRLEYDYIRTRTKILNIKELPPALGNRLLVGS